MRGAQRLNREQWRDYLTDIDPERRLMVNVGQLIAPLVMIARRPSCLSC
jgi:hypothetical protein